jgi:cysteine desulfurase
MILYFIYLYVTLLGSRKPLYFDNNGTTKPHPETIKAMTNAFQMGNASTAYATEAKDTLKKCKDLIQKWVQSPSVVVFTSGASESNNLIIRSMVDKWWLEKQSKPHIVISAIEHKTSISCCQELERLNRADFTTVEPTPEGFIEPQTVRTAIRLNTCLVSIMHSNNELGSINDIKTIAQICQSAKVPFHTDATQSFGKNSIPMDDWGISALSASFHKLHGPPGLGVLVLDPYLVQSGFPPQISGTQNFGIRGGTENMPAIAGALKTMEITFKNRSKKNQAMQKKVAIIKDCLKKHYTEQSFREYVGKSDNYSPLGAKDSPLNIVFLTPQNAIPNTLMFSITKNGPKNQHFCNVTLKKDLMDDGAIVSIGSACNTSSSGPSHVLMAIKAPYIIRCGVIRVSLSDYTTEKECKELCKKLVKNIKKQV